MKKVLTILLALTLLLCLTVTVSAAGSKIVDQAGLLTPQDASALNDRAQKIAQAYQMDVVIVTVDSLGGKTAQAFADDYYDYNGYGYGSDHSGILLLIAMNDREWAVSTCGDAIRIITNSEIDVIMQDILPHLSAGNFAYAFDEFLTHVEVQYEAGIETGDILIRLVIALAIGAAVAGIALLVMRGKMNTARQQHGAASYMASGSYDLYRCQDFYLYSRTTRTRKPENNGSGTHRSSSGRSHGGRSGRF